MNRVNIDHPCRGVQWHHTVLLPISLVCNSVNLETWHDNLTGVNLRCQVLPFPLSVIKNNRKCIFASYATDWPKMWRKHGRSAADSVDLHKRRGYFPDSEPGFTPPWLLAIPPNFLFVLCFCPSVRLPGWLFSLGSPKCLLGSLFRSLFLHFVDLLDFKRDTASKLEFTHKLLHIHSFRKTLRRLWEDCAG